MLVIGHRGASAAATENTVEAFRLAGSMGADGVELDVRMAPDGRLLVAHDPLPDDPDALDRIVELSDALAACGDMLVNVEIKNSVGEPGHDPSAAVVEPTLAEMRRHPRLTAQTSDDGDEADARRWIVSSFDWTTIQRSRAVAPDVMTAFLVVDLTPEVIDRTAAAGHAALHPWEGSVTADVVERCHAAGLFVTTWTCNDVDRARELAALGVDALCTDTPDVMRAAFGTTVAAGAWHQG